jgi:DNA invertase Pin-like site-specific DNA recombinase
MSERTRDGLEAARARGRTGGQKPKLTHVGLVVLGPAGGGALDG